MARPVIAGVDPFEPDPAPVVVAAAIAHLTGAPLIIAASYLHDTISNAVSAGKAEHELRQDAERVTAELAGDLDAERVAIGGFTGARALHELAVERDAGLIVVGSSRRGRLGRLTPGTTAERLLHGGTCPVAVAPRGLAEGWTLRSVGVGFIDLDEGRRALKAGAALANLTGGTLEAVTAVEPMFYGRGAAIPPYDTGTGSQAARDAAAVALRDALRMVERDPSEGQVFVGDPVDALVGLSQRVDVVVCGSRGYGPLESVLLGSVSHGLVRDAHGPVIVIPRDLDDAVERLIASDAQATA
jgi:nucleotide-binding universal stress UspA family protein